MSQPPASHGPAASSQPTSFPSSGGEHATSARVDAVIPDRVEPTTIPFAKVKARPELVGHTDDGEPLLKLAEGDRKAATRRDIDRRAIEAAIAQAKRQAPAKVEAEGSVAEVLPASAPKQPAWTWLAGALVPVAVVGSVVALRHLPERGAAPQPVEGGASAPNAAAAQPTPASEPLGTEPRDASASAQPPADEAPSATNEKLDDAELSPPVVPDANRAGGIAAESKTARPLKAAAPSNLEAPTSRTAAKATTPLKCADATSAPKSPSPSAGKPSAPPILIHVKK